MNLNEFSDLFDVRINSYSAANGMIDLLNFNEYEKSLFLTLALESFVKNVYESKTITSIGFEVTEDARAALSPLVKTEAIISFDRFNKDKDSYEDDTLSIDDRSVIAELPSDLWVITSEYVVFDDERLGCYNDGKRVVVYPVTLDEYNRVRDNPFRGPTRYKVLRLDIGKTNTDISQEEKERNVELVSKYNIKKYIVRYLKRPNPIVLVDLTDTNLTINGINTPTECELDESLHSVIIDLAVNLAINSRAKS